jgi:hypothetical protein
MGKWKLYILVSEGWHANEQLFYEMVISGRVNLSSSEAVRSSSYVFQYA